MSGTSLNQCWFDGTVLNAARGVGGIMGNAYTGTVTLTDCLNTGTVDASTVNNTYPKAGGIIGETSANTTVTITRCLNVGAVKTYSATCYGGVMVGVITGSNTKVEYSYGKGCERIIGYLQNGSGYTGYFYISYIFSGTTYENINRGTTSYASVPIIALQDSENYLGEAAKNVIAGFDYENTWQTVEGSTPILKNFAE